MLPITLRLRGCMPANLATSFGCAHVQALTKRRKSSRDRHRITQSAQVLSAALVAQRQPSPWRLPQSNSFNPLRRVFYFQNCRPAAWTLTSRTTGEQAAAAPIPGNPMIEFEGWRVPPGFVSDGCTCAPDAWRGRPLTDACVLHDFLRRHGIVPTSEADKILRRHLLKLGAPAWLARLYWLSVKLMRWRFTFTAPLPPAWSGYGHRHVDTGERRRSADFL